MAHVPKSSYPLEKILIHRELLTHRKMLQLSSIKFRFMNFGFVKKLKKILTGSLWDRTTRLDNGIRCAVVNAKNVSYDIKSRWI